MVRCGVDDKLCKGTKCVPVPLAENIKHSVVVCVLLSKLVATARGLKVIHSPYAKRKYNTKVHLANTINILLDTN